MARQQRFGVLLPVILVAMTTLFLTGCSSLRTEPEIKTVVKVEKTTVPVVARPKPVQLNDVKVHVVNEANYDEFVKKFKEENGQLAYVALSMRDYENLALNVAELRRFINQQINIIVYYEDAVTDDKPEETVENG